MPHFNQHYDIGTHTVKQVENEAQNFAEYFSIVLNRCNQKTDGL
jgi:hypothetical protein